MHPNPRSLLAPSLGTLLLLLFAASPSHAHTEPDAVAIPVGEAVTLTLRPTHGCDDAATVEVSARIPAEGAVAEEVPGWAATSQADGEGNTVVEWTGGLLPTDEAGAFPVTFTAPDRVGELLTFPFVQLCDDGSELAWISGDPADDYPAPRVLLLAAGSPTAATIDDVPAGAPGRELLVEIVDVDGGPGTSTTAPDDATTTTSAATTSAATSTDDLDDDDDGGGLPVPAVLAGLGLGALGGFLVVRRSRSAT